VTEHEEDDDGRDLRRGMAGLRERDAARMPAFERTWSTSRARVGGKAGRRTRLAFVLAGAAVIAGLTVAVVHLASIVPGRQGPVSLVDPEPLAFLLDRPGGAP
jgi:hypothetical protein